MLANELVHVRQQYREEKNLARLRSWVEKLLWHVDEQAKEIRELKAREPVKSLGIINGPKGRVDRTE